MALTSYQRKRNFKKSPEPSGREKLRKGPLSFVMHKHHATREHYDLRLEMGGVLKSWAVPKEPTQNPSYQRLAVFVEDHPLEYGKFEGTIPKGHYGAGTVMIWDEGTYDSRSIPGRKGEAALLKDLADGKVTVVLYGKKLRGEFALVRMKQSKNWLLIKKRDQYANYSAVDERDRSSASGRTMEEITRQPGAEWTRKGKSAGPEWLRPMAPISLSHLPPGEFLGGAGT